MTEATRELERSIRGLNWTYALIGAADATLLPYIPLYLAARHLDVLAIGLVLAVAAAGSFVAGLAWAYLADRTGKPEGAVIGAGAAAAFQAVTEIPTMGFTHVLTRRFSNASLFAIGSAIFVAVFLAWAVVTNPVALALLKFVTGIGFALTYVAAVLIADELWPARLRATGQVVIKSMMFGLAPIAGNFGGGYVYDTYGPAAMFVMAAVLMGAAGIGAMLAVPARRSSKKVETPVAPILRLPEPAAVLEER